MNWRTAQDLRLCAGVFVLSLVGGSVVSSIKVGVGDSECTVAELLSSFREVVRP